MNALLGGVLLTSDDPARYSPAARERYHALRELRRAEHIQVEADRGLAVSYELDGERAEVVLTGYGRDRT